MARFAYPICMEPPPPADIERTTVDKWHVTPELPMRGRKGLPAALQQSCAYQFPITGAAEDITLDKWTWPLDMPVRSKKLPATLHPGSVYQLPITPAPETITVDKWFRQMDFPMRMLLRRQLTERGWFAIDPTALMVVASVDLLPPRIWFELLPEALQLELLADALEMRLE